MVFGVADVRERIYLRNFTSSCRVKREIRSLNLACTHPQNANVDDLLHTKIRI